ncbi:amidohydrolase [Clostridium polyendosporum]|uniref:Amidohydrolase n=1 Tax=Clostridium polyendosporum TaxID=69208 RepID=A0A919RZ61_9CLOT|nr:carbon-nitrogen family hydrolase [Clostridium polyendosporum]GIM28944.1 amidohydrolase [Clostridium polyendosporum]
MRIALAQIDIKWEDKDFNLRKCESFIKEAKEKKANLIIFPEMTLTGFSMNPSNINESYINSKYIEALKILALKNSIYIGFGMAISNNKDFFNDFIVINNEGTIIGTYSKIHPFSYSKEHLAYRSGDNLLTLKIKEFTLSPFICYDLRFPEIFQVASRHANLITISANWPKSRISHWKALLVARAIENQCYIAGINRVGQGDNLLYNGASMIVSPSGEILCYEEDKEVLLIHDLVLSEVENLRSSFPLKNDRRETLYINLLKINSFNLK